MKNHLITLMVALPWLGALFQTIGTYVGPRTTKLLALSASLASSLVAIIVALSVPPMSAELSQVETLPWVGAFAISYRVGIDGLAIPFLLIIAVVFPILLGYEWNQKRGGQGMNALFLTLQGAFLGVVCSRDLFLQFFFWSLTSLPTYFLMGVWGGKKREGAAFRGIMSEVLSNGLVFSALVLVFYAVEPHSFDYGVLEGGKIGAATISFLGMDLSVQAIAFGLIALGLALRMGVWPLHGWLVSTAAESLPSVLAMQMSVAIPVSFYLFVRWMFGILPGTMSEMATAVVWVGATSLLVGTICGAAQKNLRGLLTYVRIAATGMALIGVGSLDTRGLVGAVYQQIAFALAIVGCGLFIGIYEGRLGSDQYGDGEGGRVVSGLSYVAPISAVVMAFFIASILCLPGMGGFVSGALLIIGAYSIHPAWVAVLGLAMVLATYSLFSMYREVFLGPESGGQKTFYDLSWRERACLLPLVAAILVTGIYPKPLMDVVRPSALTLLSLVK